MLFVRFMLSVPNKLLTLSARTLNVIILSAIILAFALPFGELGWPVNWNCTNWDQNAAPQTLILFGKLKQ